MEGQTEQMISWPQGFRGPRLNAILTLPRCAHVPPIGFLGTEILSLHSRKQLPAVSILFHPFWKLQVTLLVSLKKSQEHLSLPHLMSGAFSQQNRRDRDPEYVRRRQRPSRPQSHGIAHLQRHRCAVLTKIWAPHRAFGVVCYENAFRRL